MDALKQHITEYLNKPIDIAALVFFRVGFGLLVFFELLHYHLHTPFLDFYFFDATFHFRYPGFSWIPVVPTEWMPAFIITIAVLYILFAAGFLYRIVSVLCFLAFCLLFFQERASFLNHWYLICLITFLMSLLPANKAFSIDAIIWPKIRASAVPQWTLFTLLLLVGIVYTYSGVAKIKPEWFSGALMNIYLTEAEAKFPMWMREFVTGSTFVMISSYGTVILEVLAFPLLFWKRARVATVVTYICFHCLNFHVFTIGLFPLIMIAATLLYLPPSWPRTLLKTLKVKMPVADMRSAGSTSISKFAIVLLAIFFAFQTLLPVRRFLYHRNTSWSEEAELFSWRMFTAAKKGDISFFIDAPGKHPYESVDLTKYLTIGQIGKMMRNPDMIIQFAHYIGPIYAKKWGMPVEVHVVSELGLNGYENKPFVNTGVDLMKEPRQFAKPYHWVLAPPY